jgi:hypothetical protein
MNKTYDKAIKHLTDCSCKSSFSGVNLLIFCKVLQGPSASLEISATDVKGNYWEISLNHDDFQKHIETLGLLNSDWENFFIMMREAFENNSISGEITSHLVHLHIDYPIGEAKIRGSFSLKFIKNPAPQLISDLVFGYISKLEVKSLKRPRESSSEAKSQVIEMPKLKPKPTKKKKPKQIGSKIL